MEKLLHERLREHKGGKHNFILHGADGLLPDERSREGCMMEHFGIKPPVEVPMVRVLDESGREIMRGWYYRHVKRQPAALNDYVREDDVQHVVMHDGFADWNMPQDVKATVITPPHRIEVIDDKPWERGA